MATAQSPLTNLGYNLVALPKTGIKPLMLLYDTGNGVGSVDADLGDLFKAVDAAPPQVKKDEDTADINGSAELTLDAKGGINMLDWLMGKLNLGKLKADASFSNNYEVAVSYTNIKEDKVSLLALDGFINGAEPATQQFSTFKSKLEHSELYVINSVLKSKNIKVTITAKSGMDISADATIKGILDINAGVKRENDKTIALTYTSEDTPLAFAFKAQQIIYEKGSFWKNEPAHFRIRDLGGTVLKGPEKIATIPLHTGGELVDL